MVDDKESVVDEVFASEGFSGLAGVVGDDGDDDVEDDEVRTLPGFVKAFNRRSLSSTLIPFEVAGLLTILRFGTKIVGCLTVGSTAFEGTGCL